MVYTDCQSCGVSLEIDENDYIEGCREREDVTCPKCNGIATTVRTSGIPTARIIDKKEIETIKKEFGF
ncbi:hypothetical protein QTI71_15010 [Clostridium perfringens]|jgi:hypothetical protein|nr:hypothetical protein [Clostridium perfringens]